MKSKREWAIDFLSRGWSVIPCGPDKRPIINWKEFQSKRADESQIDLWLEQKPDLQWGIVTGEVSNLTVIDLEKGADFDMFKDQTLMVRTGGGGRHLYFKYDKDFRNAARILELCDIRSEGGYVVAPGSVSSKGEYYYLNKLPIIEMSKETKEKFVTSGRHVGSVNIFQEGKMISPEETLLNDYEGYGEGCRNDEMARFIGKIFKVVHPALWVTRAWEMVVEANKKNDPPLPIYELQSTFNSIKTRDIAKETLKTQEVIQTPPKKISEDGDEVDLIFKVAERQSLNQDLPYPLMMPVFDEVLEGGVNKGDVIVIAAPTASGKTSLAQDWTLSFLRGPRKAVSLWFSYEVMTKYLWKKFQVMGMTEEDCAVIPSKHTSGNVAWVEEKIKEAKEKFGIEVVVIDHLGFLLPKTLGVLGKNVSMNQSSLITQTVRDLKQLAIREEVIIVLPTHMRKTDSVDQNDIANSAGIAQEADAVFLLERERSSGGKDSTEYFTPFTKITLSKNRKTGITPSAWFNMINNRFCYSTRNEEIKKVKDDWNSIPETVPEKKEVVKIEEKKVVTDEKEIDDIISSLF